MKPTRYLITGGAGFIGSHLAEALLAAGHRVWAVDNLSTGSLANIAHLRDNPNFSFVRASITDSIVIDRLVSEADAIFHLAAAVGVQLIVEQPVHTIETNIMGTEAVLKTALRYGCRTFVASTSEVYGKGIRIPFNEDDDVLIGATARSRWSYAATKMIDEFLSLAYHSEYRLEVVICRLFNTVGPRQTGRYGMVVPRFVRQALRGEPITVYGEGQQSRCFCDVDDAVRALVGLMEHHEAAGKIVNVGNTEEVSMTELARRVKQRTGSASPILYVPYDKAYAPGFEDMERRVPDIGRVQRLIGWQPRIALDTILDRVIAYEREQLER